MIYAGFWKRLWAGGIDFIIFIPSIILFSWLQLRSQSSAILIALPYYLSFFLYNFYFLGKYGKTIGKMVMKIQVVSLDGNPITWRQAFLRNSVDLFWTIVAAIGCMITLFHMPESAFTGKSFVEFANIYKKHAPAWTDWAGGISAVWGLSELVVLLFNEKRRAIHDFIAGTVVVHEESLNSQ